MQGENGAHCAVYRKAKRSVVATGTWRMDENYRMGRKGAVETTSQDLSRIPLASSYLSVHDPCDIDASPSYFTGAIPRSFRNCTRGGGPQDVLLTLFSRHGRIGPWKETCNDYWNRFSLSRTPRREEFVLRFFFSFFLFIYIQFVTSFA